MWIALALLLAAVVVSVLLMVDIRLRRRPAAPLTDEAAPAPGPAPDPAPFGALTEAALLLVDADGRLAYANDVAQAEFPTLAVGAELSGAMAPFGRLIERVRSIGGSGREAMAVGEPPRPVRVAAVGDGAGGVLVLIEPQTEAIDFDEARRRFSAAVSHELRTPLARILGLAESLALPEVEDEREAIVEQIEAEVDGMRRLIDEMLLLAQLDRGRLAVAAGVVDVCAVARAVVSAAGERRIGRGRRIDVRAVGVLEAPVAERLCEVVIGNLVDNALIHGGVDASVAVDVQSRAGWVEIVVSDDGAGIPAEHLPHVFQRFYRGDAARSGPGSGLGLALVKNIVEAHEGSVVAESDGRGGTTLRVLLPRVG